MYQLLKRAAWLMLLTGLLVGCSPFAAKRDPQPVAEYLLDWQPAQAQPYSPSGPVIQITTPRAAAGFRNADMVYVVQPHRLDQFARHRWVDSPARMLEPLLVRAAEASGLFSSVVGAGIPVRSDLRLDTELQHLQLHVEAEEHRLQLALRASLIELAGGRQLASQIFSIEETSSERTPYGGVQAANRAVARLLQELTVFLARHTAR